MIDPVVKEYYIRRLGIAVVKLWDTLPQDVQQALVNDAIWGESPREAGEIKLLSVINDAGNTGL
ncbi:MAG TPA: hypothetical protein VH000_03530 [Rhizomicrobium sp.]|nr:hypothetical protein [Rhizomicrobium sp.]